MYLYQSRLWRWEKYYEIFSISLESGQSHTVVLIYAEWLFINIFVSISSFSSGVRFSCSFHSIKIWNERPNAERIIMGRLHRGRRRRRRWRILLMCVYLCVAYLDCFFFAAREWATEGRRSWISITTKGKNQFIGFL